MKDALTIVPGSLADAADKRSTLDRSVCMRKRELRERFWEKVNIGGEDECWEWQAYLNAGGYGVINDYPSTKLAHRVAWELTQGEIPNGFCCLHRCDNPRCVNPAHLFLGTVADNNHDRAQKGRGKNGPQNGESNNHSKLTWEQVQEIRGLYTEGVIFQRNLAEMYGVTQPTVSRIVGGKGWIQQ